MLVCFDASIEKERGGRKVQQGQGVVGDCLQAAA